MKIYMKTFILVKITGLNRYTTPQINLQQNKNLIQIINKIRFILMILKKTSNL